MRNTRRNKATEVNKWRKKYCNLRNVDGLVTPLFDSLVVDVYNVTILTNLMKKKRSHEQRHKTTIDRHSMQTRSSLIRCEYSEDVQHEKRAQGKHSFAFLKKKGGGGLTLK